MERCDIVFLHRSQFLRFSACALVCIETLAGCMNGSSAPVGCEPKPGDEKLVNSRSPSRTDEQTEPATQQGIQGRVVKLLGDFTLEPPLGEIVPEPVPVHVFRGRLAPIDAPNPQHAALVKIIQPDEEGRFRLSLPPGEYTLVAEIDGQLYLNNRAEDGFWIRSS